MKNERHSAHPGRKPIDSAVRLAVLVIATIGLADTARATDTCRRALDVVVTEWRSIAVPGKPEPPDHVHTALEVWYMRGQLRLALRLCEEDKDHEAMLRMDLVRAWLRLPEVRHPADHRYRYDDDLR
jgi:hypothetical protein